MKTIQVKTEAVLIIKRIIIGFGILLMIGWNTNCFGQDTIIKNNGTKFSGKVLEITSSEVRYKKSGNFEGPTYIENILDLSSINYSNGTKDTFKFEKPWLVSARIKDEEKEFVPKKKYPELHKIGGRYTYNKQVINENEMRDYLLSLHDPAITDHIQTARIQKGAQYIGFAAVPLGVASLVYFLNANSLFGNNPETKENSQNVGKLLGLAGVGCIGTSICLKIKRNQHNAAAVKLYQQKY